VSFTSSLIWRMLPKQKRRLLVNLMHPLDGRQVDLLMRGSAQLPQYFLSKKSIFVHVPKTAGTSIWESCFNEKGAGHTPYSWYQRIAPKQCREYFTFSFVRNPWDRLVSAYHYLLERGPLERDSGWSDLVRSFNGFDDFVHNWMCLENIEKHIHFVPQYRFLINRYGVIDLDYVGRFESIALDLDEIKCRIKGGGNEVSTTKVRNSSKRDEYRGYYTDETRKKVGKLYARDIELFGYSF